MIEIFCMKFVVMKLGCMIFSCMIFSCMICGGFVGIYDVVFFYIVSYCFVFVDEVGKMWSKIG